MSRFWKVIASSGDRKNVFLELGFGEHAFAEVIEERGRREIILYSDPALGPLDLLGFVELMKEALTVELLPPSTSTSTPER